MKTDLTIAEFIRLVIDILETANIEYLLGGAVAAWAWGEYRSTNDVDLVISVTESQFDPLSDALAEHDMLVPAGVMRDIVKETRVDLAINAIHPISGYKAELFPVRAGDNLRLSALERRVLVDLGSPIGEVYVHSPEDLILYKMQYYYISRQTKHTRDIATILSTQPDLDLPYIEEWARRIGLLAIWNELYGSQ